MENKQKDVVIALAFLSIEPKNVKPKSQLTQPIGELIECDCCKKLNAQQNLYVMTCLHLVCRTCLYPIQPKCGLCGYHRHLQFVNTYIIQEVKPKNKKQQDEIAGFITKTNEHLAKIDDLEAKLNAEKEKHANNKDKDYLGNLKISRQRLLLLRKVWESGKCIQESHWLEYDVIKHYIEETETFVKK